MNNASRYFLLLSGLSSTLFLNAARCDNPNEPEVQTSRSDSEVTEDEKFMGIEVDKPASELAEPIAEPSAIEAEEFKAPAPEESIGE